MCLSRAKKKLEFQFALMTSISQIGKSSFALLMIQLADDLPDPLPIRQVRMESYLPRRKSSCPR